MEGACGETKPTDILIPVMMTTNRSPSPTTSAAPANRLSAREMDSLTAICDTFLPSIQAPPRADEATRVFYATSASMIGIPDTMGEFMSGKLKHALLGLLRLALWLLSTWYGTFAVFGWRILSPRFPYFRKFSQVELRRREEALAALSHSWLPLYRMLYKALKFMIVLFYFSKVDENNHNPSWKAIGYCGPDPNFIDPSPDKPSLQDEENQSKDHQLKTFFGPLYNAMVHLSGLDHLFTSTLARAGLSLTAQPAAPRQTLTCDAVVIGSGSGGGVAAAVLATAGFKVVVLEKGPYAARCNLPLLEGHAMDTMYEGSGLLATSSLSAVILAGSAVGGGSAVNWSASIPTPPDVLKEWCEDHGLELFGSDLYREAMHAVCSRMCVTEQIQPEESLSNEKLRFGCKELGYGVSTIPRNAPADHYCGWCCFGCKDGKKKGTAETWLVDMAESENGVIIPNSKALRIIHEKGRLRSNRRVARGVVFEHEGRTYEVRSKVVVVACGALSTPVLLKRSGFRNRNIGRNLHIHPTMMAWGTFPDSKKHSYEGGIMTSMHSSPSFIIQTPALHPGMYSVLTPWVSSSDFKARMTKFAKTVHLFALVRDAGSGTVRSDGLVEYNLSEGDRGRLREGMERAAQVLAAAGAEEVGAARSDGARVGVRSVSWHEWDRWAEELKRGGGRDGRAWEVVCSAHQMGSCRMGRDGGWSSAVDERGELWEAEGVFVVDTSVFPTALGVNPMVTVMSVAWCTAKGVAEALRRRKNRAS